jgi:hypothetical protein
MVSRDVSGLQSMLLIGGTKLELLNAQHHDGIVTSFGVQPAFMAMSIKPWIDGSNARRQSEE